MKKLKILPAWFDALDGGSVRTFLPAISVVFEREGSFYFDGLIAELIKRGNLPRGIDIVLNMDDWSCMARLAFGDGSDLSASYAPFEPESFALLWNSKPSSVHGYQSDLLRLAVYGQETRFPVTVKGLVCDLFMREQRFVFQPNPDFLHLIDKAA